MQTYMIFFQHETLNFTDIFPCDEPLVSTLPPRPPRQRKNCKKNAIGNVLKALVMSYRHAHALSTIITLCSASASLPYVPPSLFSLWESPRLHCVPCLCQYTLEGPVLQNVLFFFYVREQQNRTSYHPMSYSSSLTQISGQNEA